MFTFILLLSLFTLAKTVPLATPPRRCVGTISSLNDVSEAVKCQTININGFTVPPEETFTLNLLDGTNVNVLGDIQFGVAPWNGILFELTGKDITFNGNGKKWDGGGPSYWDGQGGSSTKPDLMMSIQITGTFSGVYVLNSPTRAIGLSTDGPLVVKNVTVDNGQGAVPNEKSNGKPAGRNTDGFDISGQNIVLQDSVVINQDDCVAINNGKNIVVENVRCEGGHGLSIGSISSNAVVENVVFKDNTILNSQQAFRIKTQQAATNGRVSNIIYSGNKATNCTQYGVLVTQSYPSGFGQPGNGVTISDIKFASGTTDITVSENAQTVGINCGDGSCTGVWDWGDLKVTGGTAGPTVNTPDLNGYEM